VADAIDKRPFLVGPTVRFPDGGVDPRSGLR